MMMLLACVKARTDSTTRYSYNAGCGQFPRIHIGIIINVLCDLVGRYHDDGRLVLRPMLLEWAMTAGST